MIASIYHHLHHYFQCFHHVHHPTSLCLLAPLFIITTITIASTFIFISYITYTVSGSLLPHHFHASTTNALLPSLSLPPTHLSSPPILLPWSPLPSSPPCCSMIFTTISTVAAFIIVTPIFSIITSVAYSHSSTPPLWPLLFISLTSILSTSSSLLSGFS